MRTWWYHKLMKMNRFVFPFRLRERVKTEAKTDVRAIKGRSTDVYRFVALEKLETAV